MGLEVVTTDGRNLGRVAQILRTGANDIYELDSEVLLPAIDDVIREIDLDEGRIVVEPVEGLLDEQ